MTRKIQIVAVTACVSGVAHTYMAAEQLTRVFRAKGYAIRVEAQGALGVEDQLTAAQIEAADAVVICTDIGIDGLARFDGHRVLTTGIRKVLVAPEAVDRAMERLLHLPAGAKIEV